jgi:hypothetical protein
MNLLNLLNTFTEQAPIFLVITTIYIIATIFIKVSKKEISAVSSFIIGGIAKLLIVSLIPTLIAVYSSIMAAMSFVSSSTTITNIQISGTTSSLLSLSAIISLGASIILGIAILFMESERFVSPLIKEIESLNVNNLGKIAIKLLNIVPFILSIILIYSILSLAIYPTNMTLINTILIISQVYLYIIIFDIAFSILVAASNKELKNEMADYKNLLGKI